MINSNMLKINNININFTKEGEGEPFILIHGIFFDSSGYKNLIKILGKRYTVYSIDLPMHGKSEKPSKYISISKMSALLEEFVNRLKIKNPIVCGHSGGALVAMDYVVNNKIKELIIIEPPAIDVPLFLILVKLFLVEPLFSFFRSPIRTLLVAWVGLYNLIRNMFNANYWKLINERYNYNYSDLKKKIKCSTKILWGKQDSVYPIKNAFKFKNLRNSKIIWINGNHFWPILNPEEINKYLKTAPVKKPEL